MEKESHLYRYTHFYLILAMICWGVSWPTSKILTEYTDTYTLMFLKFSLSSLTILPFVLLSKTKTIFNKKLLKSLALATLFILLYNIIFFIGLKIGYAGVAGVIVTGSNPIFTFIVVALLEKVKISKKNKIALILGIIGTLITVDIFSLELQALFANGNLLFLVASLLWTLLTIQSTDAKKYLSPLKFTFYLYLLSSFFTYLIFGNTDNIIAIINYDAIFWINLIFTTVITTGLATTFYFKASTILGANYTSSYIFLVPLVAALSSALILQEIPSFSTLVGGGLLIYSVWLINYKKGA
jgi:drug/metabolite transporter (DMT)-like permease